MAPDPPLMPILDLPLEQLHRYEGRNPRPADFDAYWDRALAELAATDPQPELVAHEMKAPWAECFHLYFTGVGGARVHAKLMRPSDAGEWAPGAALLMFHGYAGSSGEWSDKLQYVAQGFTVAAMDCRGQGGLSEEVGGVQGNTLRGHIIRGLADAIAGRPEKLLYRDIFLDTAQLARVVMGLPWVDPDRVGATGASQGGALTLACAALVPQLRKAAPVYPFLCDYQRVWEMDLALNAYEELRLFFRHHDPRHEREREAFNALGYIDCQHLAPRVRAEVLMPIGLMDAICPPSTQFAAYNRIPSKKNLLLYPDFGHEALPGAPDRIFNFLADL